MTPSNDNTEIYRRTNALVSVVIPAWNAEKWIAETLNSVQNQTWARLEVIVVDDGSTDRTASIVQNSFPEVRYLHQPNAGQGAARNLGVRAAKGEFIAFLDSDDLWLPEKIESQLRLIAHSPNVSLVFCDYESFGETPNLPGFQRGPVLRTLPANPADAAGNIVQQAALLLPLIDDMFCQIPSCWLLRRELFEQVGGYDETLRQGGEDWLLAVQLANHGDFAFDTRRLVKRREVSLSHSKRHRDTPGLIQAMTALIQQRASFPSMFMQKIEHRLAFNCLYAGLAGNGTERTRLLRAAISHAGSLSLPDRIRITLRAVMGLIHPSGNRKTEVHDAYRQ